MEMEMTNIVDGKAISYDDIHTNKYSKDKLIDNNNDDDDDDDEDLDQVKGSVLGCLDPCNCCPSHEQLEDGSLVNRLFLCFFAIALLWLSSLYIAVELVSNYIESPDSQVVYDTCDYAYDVVRDQKDQYDSCANIQVDGCNTLFDQDLEEEVTRFTEALEYNEYIIELAESYQTSCTSTYSLALNGMSEWQTLGYTIDYNVICSTSETDEISELTNDISALRTEAFGYATDYINASESTVSRLSAYAEARAAYDVEYVYNKTEGLREGMRNLVNGISTPYANAMNLSIDDIFPDADRMVGCISLRDEENNTGCFPELDSARAQFDSMRTSLDNQINVATADIEEFDSQVTAYVSRVDDAYNNMLDFYYGVTDAISSAGISTDSWGSFWSLGPSDFFASEGSWPGTVSFPEVDGADEIWNNVDTVFDDFLGNLTLVGNGIGIDSQQWSTDLDTSIAEYEGLSADDYNPPEYNDYSTSSEVVNATDENTQMDETSEEFIGKLAVSLNAFSELNQYEDDDYDFITTNFSSSDGSSFYSNTYFTYEPLSSGDLDFDLWMVSLGSIANLFFIMDLIFRIYHSFRLFRRYWSRSALGIPDADIRWDKHDYSCGSMSPSRLTFVILTHPIVPIILFIIFLLALIILISVIYIPFYEEYVNGCVHPKTENDTGTFLTDNLYSIAYNYASEDGNEAIWNGIDEYNIDLTDYCSQYSATSEEQMNEYELYFNSLTAAHESNYESVSLLKKCINTDILDPLFQEACCGEGDYDNCINDQINSTYACPYNEFDNNEPYDLISNYIETTACNVSMVDTSNGISWELEDGIFYCENLPTCTITCGGPDEELIKTVTLHCGCMIEYWFHAGFFKISISFVVYLLMNLSRIIFISGICRLFWKHLHPGIFTYRGTCNRYGELLAPPRSVTKGKSDDEVIKEALDKVLSRYEKLGYFLIFLALILNGPWIAFLILAGQDIEYHPV